MSGFSNSTATSVCGALSQMPHLGLWLGNCREPCVHRPHYLVRMTAEWTRGDTRCFLGFARGAENLERLAAFLASHDLLHRPTRKLR